MLPRCSARMTRSPGLIGLWQTQVASATWSRWADHAVTTRPDAQLRFSSGSRPSRRRMGVAAELARLVRGRPMDGWQPAFSAPLWCFPPWPRTGFFDEAYLMLLRHEVPSWLYQVDQGATTVWERWDAIRPDGSIHPGTMTSPPDVPESESGEGHMLSFNHYAYGAVVDWVYRHVAGRGPRHDESRISRTCVFAPKPVDRDRLGPGIGRQCVRQSLYFMEHHGRWYTGR